MAKRDTGIGRQKKKGSHKTKKRLEKKKRMLEIKAMKPAERKKVLKELREQEKEKNK